MARLADFFRVVLSHWVLFIAAAPSLLVSFALPAANLDMTPAMAYWLVGLATVVAFYRAWAEEHAARLFVEAHKGKKVTAPPATRREFTDAIWLVSLILVVIIGNTVLSWLTTAQLGVRSDVMQPFMIRNPCQDVGLSSCEMQSFQIVNTGREATAAYYTLPSAIVNTPNDHDPNYDENVEALLSRLKLVSQGGKGKIFAQNAATVISIEVRPMSQAEIDRYKRGDISIIFVYMVDLRSGILHRQIPFCWYLRGNALPAEC